MTFHVTCIVIPNTAMHTWTSASEIHSRTQTPTTGWGISFPRIVKPRTTCAKTGAHFKRRTTANEKLPIRRCERWQTSDVSARFGQSAHNWRKIVADDDHFAIPCPRWCAEESAKSPLMITWCVCVCVWVCAEKNGFKRLRCCAEYAKS